MLDPSDFTTRRFENRRAPRVVRPSRERQSQDVLTVPLNPPRWPRHIGAVPGCGAGHGVAHPLGFKHDDVLSTHLDIHSQKPRALAASKRSVEGQSPHVHGLLAGGWRPRILHLIRALPGVLWGGGRWVAAVGLVAAHGRPTAPFLPYMHRYCVIP